MSSRLEKRFSQASASKLTDPILLSGLDPSLIHELQTTEDIRSVVDAVIRQQWQQVHPDLASSPDEMRRREAARGALDEALTQLKSADFGRCLREFREKFPARDVPAPASFIQSFSMQFEPLDMLIRTGHKEIPLTALRDVSIELFDLPRLSREIDRELSTGPASKILRYLQDLLHRTPETITFANIEGFAIGTREFQFYETSFGRTLYGILGRTIQASGNPELRTLQALFNLSQAHEADLDYLEGQVEELMARHSEELAAIWNSALTEDAVRTRLKHFAAQNEESVRKVLLTIDVRKLRDFARNMPLKRLYIDSSGRFNESDESGSLHTAPELRASLIKYDDGFCDIEDDEPLNVLQQDEQSFINRLIYAALDQRVQCSMRNPLQLPENPKLSSSREFRIHATRRTADPSESLRLGKVRQGASRDSFRLPGSEYSINAIFYDATLGYPPTVSASFFTDSPAAPTIDVPNPILLTSHRTNPLGESFFYLEGFINRIHWGK